MFKLFVDNVISDFYVGLIFECPYKDELDNCPFKNIRQLKIEKRLKLYRDYFGDLVKKHKKCIMYREMKEHRIKTEQ